MTYTTFIENGPKPDEFDRFGWYLDEARRAKSAVYLIAISRNTIEYPQNVAETFAKLPGVSKSIAINGTIDVIVMGDEEKAKEIARKMHIETGEPVAILLDENKEPMSAYIDIRHALDVTRRTGQPWHIYNPKTESVEASLDRLLKQK